MDLSAPASVNTSASMSDVIIINVLIIARLNESMTKFVANAFIYRFYRFGCSPNSSSNIATNLAQHISVVGSIAIKS